MDIMQEIIHPATSWTIYNDILIPETSSEYYFKRLQNKMQHNVTTRVAPTEPPAKLVPFVFRTS